MNITTKFAYSFFDFDAYKEFIVQGLGKAIFYIFLVTVVFSTLGNIRIVSDFNDAMAKIESDFNKESPDFEYKDGKLTVYYDGPIHYTYNDNSQEFPLLNNFIVDTSGKTDSSILDYYNSGIFLDSDSITIKSNTYNLTTIPLKKFIIPNLIDSNDDTLNKASVSSLFPLFNDSFDTIMFIIGPIRSFVSNLISVFFFLGPLTIILSKNLNINLSYKAACTIGFYAMTMPLLLESLSIVAGVYNQQYSLIFYIVGFIYCYLVLKNIQKSSNTKINTLL